MGFCTVGFCPALTIFALYKSIDIVNSFSGLTHMYLINTFSISKMYIASSQYYVYFTVTVPTHPTVVLPGIL